MQAGWAYEPAPAAKDDDADNGIWCQVSVGEWAARFYYPDGNYRTTVYSWNAQGTTVDGYVRLLGNQGAEITGMKIRKEDGTEIDYKIVDRR